MADSSHSSLHLKTASSFVACKVHPVVILSILDHYIRRTEEHRVIGTLVGTVSDGVVEIKNCFPVPHTEGDQVGVDMEYHHNMIELHHKISPKEIIVGWYATGPSINEASVMIHEFYWREMNHSPIHLTVDTQLTNNSLQIKAYVSSNITFGDKPVGSQFLAIPLETQTLDAEKIGVDLLLKGEASRTTNELLSDVESIESSIQKLQQMLVVIQQYVDNVLAGKEVGDAAIGRHLLNSVTSTLPQLTPAGLESMFSGSLQDLLLVVYLANLTRTQLALADKLNKAF